MKIPYVIDNQTHTLAGVLNELLAAMPDVRSISPAPFFGERL
jgi:hypothetical protein